MSQLRARELALDEVPRRVDAFLQSPWLLTTNPNWDDPPRPGDP